MRARQTRLRLDPDSPRLAARSSAACAHFDDRAERIVLVDVAVEVGLRSQFDPQPVDPNDPRRTFVVARAARSRVPAAAQLRIGSGRRAHRQFERSAEHRYRCVVRRWPDHRPIRRGKRHPDPVSGRKYRASVIELDAHAIALARHQWRRRLVSVPMSKFMMPKLTRSDAASGCTSHSRTARFGQWPVNREVERHDRRSEDLDARIERCGFEHQRPCIVFLLVAGLVGALGRTGTSFRHRCRQFARSKCSRRQRRRVSAQPCIGEAKAMHHDARRWPRWFGNPASWQFLVKRRGPHAFRHPCAQHGFVHHTIIKTLQPMIPPAQRLLQETDLWARQREMRIGVCPWSDQALARHRQVLEQTRDGVGIAVGPAADREDRTLDRSVVLADRAVLPIVVAPLVPCPKSPGTAAGYSGAPATSPSSGRRQERGPADGTSRRTGTMPNRSPARSRAPPM